MSKSAQSGNILIALVMILILITGLAIYFKSNLSQTPKPISYGKTNQNLNKTNRIIYDFNKMLSSNFLLFKNNDIGFSIEYPHEMKIYQYNPSEINKDSYNNLKYRKELNLSLVSQTSEGTELYDGLSLNFYYYENPNKFKLDEVVPKKSTNPYPSEGNITSREDTKINSITGIKTFTCCWGGGTTSYYFPTKNGTYFLRIELFTAGPDKEKFNQVANKMIQSFKYIP